MTAAWTSRSIPPAKSGSREGWTFRQRSSHRRQNDAETMRIYPISSTSSTPAASSSDVTSASNSSR
eukprot:39785-Eustigmatos_ZCMA.PRE.1